MTLQLSGQSEILPEPHREFYGQARVQMPLLVSGKDEKGNVVDVPRDPASFAYVLERRMNAPEDVRGAWQKNYIFTGDGSTAGTEGDHLIVFDARALREITPESDLYNGALILPASAWRELKEQKDKVVYLTAEEVGEAHGRGYVKKNGVWAPANRSVGKAWDALGRGRDLTSYIQLVSEHSPHSDSLLNVYLNPTTKYGKPTMRSWVAGRTDYNSYAYGNSNLSDDDERLVGVAPELSAGKSRTEQSGVTGAHVAREKALEARVQSALETGKAF